MLDFDTARAQKLDFLWLELTNRCNLNCVHCYAESGPYDKSGSLSCDQYRKLLSDAAAAGCHEVQFIGGEPTLNPDLPELIVEARRLGFQKIEVFTNLHSLNESLIRIFKENDVCVATSIYSAHAETHDRITTFKGSFDRLVRNVQRCLALDIKMRAGFIEMDLNRDGFEQAREFFSAIGIDNIGHDHERKFGRASDGECCGMEELCGECANGTLAVGPDGTISPCVMSKQWAVAKLGADKSLTDVLESEALLRTRESIRQAVDARTQANRETMVCTPKTCAPYDSQDCAPIRGGCNPCYPKG